MNPDPEQGFSVLPDRYSRRWRPAQPLPWILASSAVTVVGLGALGFLTGRGHGGRFAVIVGALLIAAGVVLFLKRPQYSHRPRYACRHCTWTGEYPYHHHCR